MKRLLWKFAILAMTFALSVASTQIRRALRQPQTTSPPKSQTARTALPQPEVIDQDVPLEGRYSNFDYAYSALVPKGMIALLNGTPPTPNHGFGIDLTSPQSISWIRNKQEPEAMLWVDGSYDSAEYGSPRVVIRNELKWLSEKHNRVRLMTKSPTPLGSLRGLRFVIAYEDSGRQMIEDTIVAFRSQLGEGSDIIYTIGLTTPASRYDEYKGRLVDIQQSWIIDPLPNDYPILPVNEGNN